MLCYFRSVKFHALLCGVLGQFSAEVYEISSFTHWKNFIFQQKLMVATSLSLLVESILGSLLWAITSAIALPLAGNH